MDKILQNLRESLSLYDVEYQEIKTKYAQVKAQKDYLENARNDFKRLIAETEQILNLSPSNCNNPAKQPPVMKSHQFRSDQKTDQSDFKKAQIAALTPENKDKTIGNKADSIADNPSSEEVREKAKIETAAGIFKKMTLIQAVVKLLRIVKIPQTTRQISDALLRGGYKTNARDFTDTVRGTLKQYKHPKGEMLWIDNKWELKEWHSEL